MSSRDENTNREIHCSFCGKPQELVGRMIAGNGVYICDECVELCLTILHDGEEEKGMSPIGNVRSDECV